MFKCYIAVKVCFIAKRGIVTAPGPWPGGQRTFALIFFFCNRAIQTSRGLAPGRPAPVASRQPPDSRIQLEVGVV